MKRKHRPILIESLTAVGTWEAAFDGQSFDDAAAASKALRTSGLVGPYRIVSLIWAGQVQQQTVVRPRLVEGLMGGEA